MGKFNFEAYQTAEPISYELLKEYARAQRKNPTEAEQAMWQLLRKNFKSYKFRRQHVVGEYIADFICLSEKLVVEIDGGYHDVPEQQAKDRQRTEWMQKHNLQVVRFDNEEVLYDSHNVIYQLKKLLTNKI
ncbi:MAG: endonuclease domain-containing protein [Bacteroidaceae bacterium]|nr:endonuclease domain-containing protein [Bacteroidaceae bacterium]